jgi:mono/diheme cytochrome c family protein
MPDRSGLGIEAPVAAPAPVGTPVLLSPREGIGGLYAGVIAVLAVTLLLGFLVPALAGKGDEVRSSSVPYSEPALRGRQVYLEQGCGSCHTQMIRPLVADAGLGPVTLADTNQVLGYRRAGPDLAAIGSRTEDEATLRALLTAGAIEHPANGALSAANLDDLIRYLMESE